MVCFEIHVNGAKTCSAEIGERGVLAALLSWHAQDARSVGQQESDVAAGFPPSPSAEQVRWLRCPMLPGDEITIRVVELHEQEMHAANPRAACGLGT